jgi:ribosomal protein L18E
MENKYTEEEQSKQIKDVYTKIFNERKEELKINISRLSEPNNLEQPIVL